MSTQTVLSERSTGPAHTLHSIHENSIQLPSIIGAMIGKVATSAELKATAEAVLQESNRKASVQERPATATRSDSVQEDSAQLEAEKASKLHIETTNNDRPSAIHTGSLAQSPLLRQHVIHHEESSSHRLPAVSPPSAITAASPAQSQQLPSIRHLTHQLSELADIAMREDMRSQAQSSPVNRHHRHSLSSVNSQPSLPYYSLSANRHTSPTGYAMARSPSGPIPDAQHSYTHLGYHNDRRSSSSATESSRGYSGSLHSIRSASISGESGQGVSSADGYSTAHTTPIEMHAPLDNTHSSRHLPPPAGMMTFKCDFEGCTANFQTQYLLSSHKNVHSSVRTHFCPIKDCPRGEGGKGFKRKNEMIRHGLVHKSPGYICPFCPDVERKYPRPDNLQRHVRVHHGERDRDDPALREVLAQRTEGTVRANRRRRTLGSISVQS